jgi:hypothetical protein
LKVEYVVNPPSTPTVRASCAVGETQVAVCANSMRAPSANEPTRFTLKVPQGNPAPSRSPTHPERR